jgi:hypothetical protein
MAESTAAVKLSNPYLRLRNVQNILEISEKDIRIEESK